MEGIFEDALENKGKYILLECWNENYTQPKEIYQSLFSSGIVNNIKLLNMFEVSLGRTNAIIATLQKLRN